MSGPGHNDSWPEGMVTRLRTLWAEGLSTSEIGRRLGVSKNSVVSKAHRLDLPARKSPIRRAVDEAGRPVVPTAYELAVRHRLAEGGAEPLPPFHPIAAAVLRGARWLMAPALVLAMLAGPAVAAPPAPGSEDHRLLAPHSSWIHSLRRDGVSCCDMSDGRPVEARIEGGRWQVRFRPGSLEGAPVGWVDVEDGAVMARENPVGVPVAFWVAGRVLCFVPASLF